MLMGKWGGEAGSKGYVKYHRGKIGGSERFRFVEYAVGVN